MSDPRQHLDRDSLGAGGGLLASRADRPARLGGGHDGDRRRRPIVAPGDAAEQARQVLENVRTALERAGARLEHVVRTRMYVRNVGDWEAVGRVHGEYFGAIRPASTMVEVSGLVDPQMLVEIEVDAYVTG